MLINKILIVLFISIIISGCAKRPESISSSYVSYEKFIDKDCSKLEELMIRTTKTLQDLSKKQDNKANADAVGMFLFGISFSQMTGDYEAEIARLKGQIEAIETAQVKNKCIVIE